MKRTLLGKKMNELVKQTGNNSYVPDTVLEDRYKIMHKLWCLTSKRKQSKQRQTDE